MDLGVYTFGDMAPRPDGSGAGPRLRQLVDEIALADAVGLDVFGVGEHHRPDYSVSAPPIVLAAGAARSERIALTSAVTVLSSEDPVRVYQQYATLDLISGNRAEIMVGRGSFIESFPLFGQDLADYDRLFAENLELLLAVRDNAVVRWPGGLRPAIADRGVFPRPERPLPIWVAVGGTPQSVVRAGSLGLPLALAIIGGEPERFAPLVELYRQAGARAGQPKQSLAIGINAHGFVAPTSQEAADAFYPGYAEAMSRIGRERGWSGMTRDAFAAGTGPRGHLLVGSPAEVVDKILAQHEHFGHDRFLMQMAVGPVPTTALMRSIELFGTKVAPEVRRALSRAVPAAGPGQGEARTGPGA
jgi:probable LLM family oxidoreductase